jgi:hypothetical protein
MIAFGKLQLHMYFNLRFEEILRDGKKLKISEALR